MNFFIGGLIFFIAMTLTLFFTVYLYIKLVIAVKNNNDVPKWMYGIGHALKGRGRDIYKDFTDKSVLNKVNAYLIGVLTASIAVYFIFYDKNSSNDAIKFWLFAEFFIVVIVHIVIDIGKALLGFIFPTIGKAEHSNDSSAAANAVIRMILISVVVCILTLMMMGIPVKAPIVQVEDYKIVIGHTTANDLLSNGFAFAGKTANDMIVNKRDNHFRYGQTVELVKDGKGYGYVNLTPRYEDEARLADCVITYFGISSKSNSFGDVKICDKNISKLSNNDFKKINMRNIFSLSPISYQESSGNEHFSLRMQTYPYMLWKRYTIEVTFFSNDESNQFEVYAQHTLWE